MSYSHSTRLEVLQARNERTAMETDLRELVIQLEPLQDQQRQSLCLREQLGALKARLQHSDALQVRCGKLLLSFQSQQQDLGACCA
jgi:hypothetical protein